MAMPQVDWESIKSFVQIPLSWFKEVSRRSNIFSKHPIIIVERNNPDGIALNINPNQLPEALLPFAYNEETHKVSGGAICLSRQYFKVEEMSKMIQDGDVRLKIQYQYPLTDIKVSIELGDGFEAPTDSVAYVPLFKLDKGKIVEDYRGAPVHVIRE